MTDAQYTEYKSILVEAEEIINGQRRKDYGGVTESFTNLAELWTAYLSRHVESRVANTESNRLVDLSPQDVVNLMILMKVSRAQNGFHRDSYVDIAGYSGCAEKIMLGE